MRIVFFFLATLLAACGRTSRLVDKPTQIIGMSGLVTDSVTPIPLARVELLAKGKVVAQSTTNREGRFALGPQDPGEYQVVVRASGYEDCHRELISPIHNIAFELGLTRAGDSLALRQRFGGSDIRCGCRILSMSQHYPGTKRDPDAVIDSTTVTPPGLRVTVKDDSDGGYVSHAVVSLVRPGVRDVGTISNEKGRANFSLLPPGSYEMLVRRVGYSPQRRHITVDSAGVREVEVEIHWDPLGMCGLISTS